MLSILAFTLALAAQDGAALSADDAATTVTTPAQAGSASDGAARSSSRKSGFKFSTPRDAPGPIPGSLVGGIVSLVAGLAGFPTALVLVAGGSLCMVYILWRYMDWDQGKLNFNSDQFIGVSESDRDRDNYEEQLMQRVLWNGGRYALTASIFITMGSLLFVGVGAALIAGWALFQRE